MADVSATNVEKMRTTLTELGIYEAGMCVKDMEDLIAAIQNSQASAREEDRVRETVIEKPADTPKKGMQRRYITTLERRMPWSLFPIPDQLSLEQKAQVMAAYKEQQNICRYRKAKTSVVFAEWNCIFSIPISKQKQLPDAKAGIHHTRSGRVLKAAPHYTDDGSDSESSSVTKRCRKKVKMNTTSKEYIMAKSSLFRDEPVSPVTRTDAIMEAAGKQNAQTQVKKIYENINIMTKRVPDNRANEANETNYVGVIRDLSPSPECTASKMTVVAQVHREFRTPDKMSAVKNAHCDNMQDDQESLGISSRKRPKRLKLVAEDE